MELTNTNSPTGQIIAVRLQPAGLLGTQSGSGSGWRLRDQASLQPHAMGCSCKPLGIHAADLMDLDTEIKKVIAQEQRLLLPRFDLELAWHAGNRLREVALENGHALAIEVRLGGETVFFGTMNGVAPINTDWARRKRNTVELMQRSSWRVGLELQRDNRTLHDLLGLPQRDYARHGGSFPLRVAGVGCVGAVTVSGAPDHEDHAMVVRVLAELAEVDRNDLVQAPTSD
jgi:uncharacterized protein (UPF0303 family)